MNQHQQDPAEVVEGYAAKADLAKFAEMCRGFFMLKAADRRKLLRRPPIALCLPHGDHIFTVRPGWNAPRIVRDRVDGTEEIVAYGHFDFLRILIDCVESNRGKACKLLLAGDGLKRAGIWYYHTAPAAVEAFVEMVNYFVLFPWQVFAKSKDRCCVCRKSLTDEVSRSRGIGPECIKSVSLYFGQCVGR
jgi:hypothetical protein